jgi:hypothetical protein
MSGVSESVEGIFGWVFLCSGGGKRRTFKAMVDREKERWKSYGDQRVRQERCTKKEGHKFPKSLKHLIHSALISGFFRTYVYLGVVLS